MGSHLVVLQSWIGTLVHHCGGHSLGTRCGHRFFGFSLAQLLLCNEWKGWWENRAQSLAKHSNRTRLDTLLLPGSLVQAIQAY